MELHCSSSVTVNSCRATMLRVSSDKSSLDKTFGHWNQPSSCRSSCRRPPVTPPPTPPPPTHCSVNGCFGCKSKRSLNAKRCTAALSLFPPLSCSASSSPSPAARHLPASHRTHQLLFTSRGTSRRLSADGSTCQGGN